MSVTRVFCAAALWLLGASASHGDDWPHYGGDLGGQRYSRAQQITPETVGGLIRAWEYRTGDVAGRSPKVMRRTKLQGTPVLYGDSLYVCSAFNMVAALDPATGTEKWRYDPKVPENLKPGNLFGCRGVAVWEDLGRPADAQCRLRVFTGTTDARIIALDGRTGMPCEDFGTAGTVKIDIGMAEKWPGEFQITSAPVAVRDTVIVGSAISDNVRVEAPKGVVRGFDARTGALKWQFDPVPQTEEQALAQGWAPGSHKPAGHANVWAPMSADAARGLVFLPTSSPSPDFFGGLRAGDNRHANSVVALRAETGELVWAFQIVHHDVWDYDTPAQPTLTSLELPEGRRDVVIQGTKQGLVFVLDRDTGKPVFPVEERPVPQGGVAGEVLSPTQPFPTHIPPLVPSTIKPDDAWGLTPFDQGACRDAIANARSEGLYTPPSEKGTLMYPFTGGGINWGGVSVDPDRQVLYVNTSRMIHKITLVPRDQYESRKAKRRPLEEFAPQAGTPYGMIRETFLSPLFLPCNPPPWGVLTAVDLKTGKRLWESVLGTTESLAPLAIPLKLGTPSLGGPVATRGGVIFIGATMDHYLRAFDAKSGAELWAGALPAPGIATPSVYSWKGRQYVVIAAGGTG
ncbi:MAG TPA: pyrroloquinoline quinone-dependent dehydrogenase, partial [Alphaproteobacteria bacterium]|nr:pyrroloquinoline quinone-dependent dehydrogenase [Alphaproteobacteria bacterium]